MKKILSFLLFVLIATSSFAQNNNYEDVVYLKNGSIIRGIIIEQKPNVSIKIQTSDNSVFVYEMDEIEKMTKEKKTSKVDPFRLETGYIETGFKGIVELGYQTGVNFSSQDVIKLNIIYGYQVNPFFSLGLGTGVRYYIDGSDAFLIPVFADFRGYLPLNSKISPYISLGIGYSFDTSDTFNSVGFMFNPTIGMNFKVSDKSAMNIGLGVEKQKGEMYSFDDYSDDFDELSISIIVGISF